MKLGENALKYTTSHFSGGEATKVADRRWIRFHLIPLQFL